MPRRYSFQLHVMDSDQIVCRGEHIVVQTTKAFNSMLWIRDLTVGYVYGVVSFQLHVMDSC